jgi:predicted nucleotidyltransferase
MPTRHDPQAGAGVSSAPLQLGDVRIDPRVLADFAERHHIVRVSLFGSVLRGDDRPESDIDLLVEFEPGNVPGYLALALMEIELSTQLGRRRVDLRTPADLSHHFRDRVVREARLLHAR